MTTTIYEGSDSRGTIDVMVVTDCLDIESFIDEFSDALLKACRSLTNTHQSKVDVFDFSRAVMARGFKVGLKVYGYKADEVSERRLLACGPANYNDSRILGENGKGEKK